MALYPFTFHPILKERVWGGRKLEQLYHKPLPPSRPIGESWELSDHGEDISVIANGPLAGKNLRWLIEQHSAELLGEARSQHGRFPLLIKILDAQEKLSLQVHPPAHRAAALGGEPKTEMWYIADAEPGAELYVGLRRGVTREQFEHKIKSGEVAECFHRIQVRSGDTMFLPSGRVHAIGGGLVIFEIQQNSDTTYRVFDWNRVGLDGKPRALHVKESLASIEFNDFEPALVNYDRGGKTGENLLVEDPLFSVALVRLEQGATRSMESGAMQIVGLVTGGLQIAHGDLTVELGAGQFCLIPARLSNVTLRAQAQAMLLLVKAG